MSITDELRSGVANYPFRDNRDFALFEGIADRIDAAHEEAIQREHESAYDAGYDDGYASADDWCAQHEDAMNEHGWVKLPKDADGECIHIGDVMGHRDFPNAKYTVVGIGEDAFFTRDGAGEIHKHIASIYPHYKPTVEDVLREFFSRYVTTKPKDEDDAIIAEFAAKLRLRGDE